ncbi:predicted protein [Naegleria gruberi]|uniref:Predicted protein n=1 Tax=Naegleria gruberi TaxID=5762 RepID=D2UYM7_NAEGR|nr:uncharacterized protein NAEGRDRAFT_28998 [Naegleria gruberi]EFC50821.1 predicted protein [Naegleria gruberi]|eukprot:XP_002683565.1 predicted protein [Naegleria gruberi strain NEG-M]
MSSDTSSSTQEHHQQQQPKSGVDFLRNLRTYTTQQQALPAEYHFDQNTPPPEYLELDEQDNNRILEKSMNLVGRVYIGCLGLGAVQGAYHGLRFGQGGSLKVRFNAVLNHSLARSLKLANSVAAAMLFYNFVDIGMNYLGKVPENDEDKKNREEKEAQDNISNLSTFNFNENGELANEEEGVEVYDEMKNPPINALFAGMLAGMLYRTPSPFKKIVRSGFIGASIAVAHSIHVGRFDPFTPLENSTWMRDWVMPIYDRVAPERFTTLFREIKSPNGTNLYPKIETLISSFNKFSERATPTLDLTSTTTTEQVNENQEK